jgi:hypothetical protein
MKKTTFIKQLVLENFYKKNNNSLIKEELNAWKKYFYNAVYDPAVDVWNIKVNPKFETIFMEDRDPYKQNDAYEQERKKIDDKIYVRGYIVGTQLRQVKNRLKDWYIFHS